MIFLEQHWHNFGNKKLVSLYLTLWFVYFAEGLISIFVPIYLYELGIEIPFILLYYLIYSVAYVALTFLLLPILKHLTNKTMIGLAVPFMILYFMLLNLVAVNQILLYVAPLVLAVGLLFFNIGYHVTFAESFDKDKVGREVGLTQVFTSLSKMVAPFVGGLIIGLFGFYTNFMVASAIMFLAVIPLYFMGVSSGYMKTTTRKIFASVFNKKIKDFNISVFGLGAEKIISIVIWPLYIYLIIGSTEKFGGLISLGFLTSMLMMYFLGFLSDIGKRRKILLFGSIGMLSVWILRIMTANDLQVIALHIIGEIFVAAIIVSWSTQSYKISRAVPDDKTYFLARDMVLNFARIIIIPILIFAFYLLSFDLFFTISFAIAGLLVLLFVKANKVHTSQI